MLRRDVRFNGGRGAILCNACRVIIKSNLTKEEINDPTPMFCIPCRVKGKDGLVVEQADTADLNPAEISHTGANPVTATI